MQFSSILFIYEKKSLAYHRNLITYNSQITYLKQIIKDDDIFHQNESRFKFISSYSQFFLLECYSVFQLKVRRILTYFHQSINKKDVNHEINIITNMLYQTKRI